MATDPFYPLDAAPSPRAAKAPAKDLTLVAPVPADAPARPAQHPSLGKPSASWEYRDAAGALLGAVCRFDSPAGKEFRPATLWRGPRGLGWRWESWTAPRPLYGLDRLAARAAAPVIITEGEKAADAAGRLLSGHVATASPNGSKSADKADWQHLKGRHVTIWPDADEPGAAYADKVAALLAPIAASVALITPPDGVAAGWDAADAEAEGWTPAQAEALAKAATRPAKGESAKPEDSKDSEPKTRQRRPAQRDSLMQLTGDITLWHSPDGDGFATIPIGTHHENWPIRSKQFRDWLSAQAYRSLGIAPGSQAIEDTLRVLTAIANAEGDRREPWRRIGEHDSKVYLDLCDTEWRAIEITPQGWTVRSGEGLPFVRSPGMRPLFTPEAGEPIERLRGFVNVADDESFMLAVGWLVGAVRPRGPYPLVVINGEQGSGKSNFSRLLRSLIDPNAAPIRATPKDERDVVVAAINSHVLAFDNLSKVEPWLSDAFCRLSTGGGFSTRALHTDSEELLFSGTRPIILNGIPALTDRPDLGDRAINVRLQAIPETERRTEAAFWEAWEAEAPYVLGALLDAVSSALRHQATTQLERSPRMADFALWVTAAEQGLGWEPRTFLAAYMGNRGTVAENAFEADPVAVAIDKLAREAGPDGWHGTPTELLTELTLHVSESVRRSRAWPLTAQALGNRLDRIAPLLRGRSIHLERRHSGVRTVTIVAIPPTG